MTARQAVKRIQSMYPECSGIKVDTVVWKFYKKKKDIEISYQIW